MDHAKDYNRGTDMNPLQANQLVDEFIALPDLVEAPVTDQISAAINQRHDQLVLLDAIFRRIAHNVFRIAPTGYDVHDGPFSVQAHESVNPDHVQRVMTIVGAYLCGDPVNCAEQLQTLFVEPHDKEDNAAVFGYLMTVLYESAGEDSPFQFDVDAHT